MIYLYDEMNNITVQFNGRIKENLTKRGYNTVTSTRGEEFQEYIRGVINLNIEIIYMTEEEYENFKLVFLNSTSSIYVEDDTTGKVYKNYNIQGDSYSFDKDEDYDTKSYFYKGNITLNKK